MKHSILSHEFVGTIPEELREGVIYISIEFATVVHKCCCGCGSEVATPLSPTDWTLIFDGETVSLDPSVGSWNLPCQSHYWIKHNRVQWARPWTREQIAAERSADLQAKAKHYGTDVSAAEQPRTPVLPPAGAGKATSNPPVPREGFWRRLWKQLFGS